MPRRPSRAPAVFIALLASCVRASTAPLAAAPTPPPAPVVAEPAAPTPRYPAPVEEYLRALRLDRSRPDAWYDIATYCLRYGAGTPSDLRRGRGYLERFVSLAWRDERYRSRVERANRELRSIGSPPALCASPCAAGPPIEREAPVDCAPAVETLGD